MLSVMGSLVLLAFTALLPDRRSNVVRALANIDRQQHWIENSRDKPVPLWERLQDALGMSWEDTLVGLVERVDARRLHLRRSSAGGGRSYSGRQ